MCFFFNSEINDYIDVQCPVCLKSLHKAETIAVALNCGHILCYNCAIHYVTRLLFPSKYLDISNMYSELNFQQIKCPLCRLNKYGNFIYLDKLKCINCSTSCQKLIEKNKQLFHLKCGHICCKNCLKKYDINKKIRCIYCLNNNLFFPLFI